MSQAQRASVGKQHKNVFNTKQHSFPDLVNGKINTAQFLQACKDVVVLLDEFKTYWLRLRKFYLVSRDMTSNIEILEAKYKENKQQFKYLQDMVLFDKSIAVYLLWLRRGIHLMYYFFRAINDDYYKGENTEILTPFIMNAYEKTLRPFHRPATQYLVSTFSPGCPTRTDLMEVLAVGEEVHDESVMHSMKEFLNKLQSNIEALVKFYSQNGLESTLVV